MLNAAAHALQEYLQVFEPLLLEETAAQLRRGQEEGQLSEPQQGVVGEVGSSAVRQSASG
jgi:hypothetical protein